eukprot:SAG22_NODE_8614_length_641_cov_1.241697_2_plen_34_part_01
MAEKCDECLEQYIHIPDGQWEQTLADNNFLAVSA